MHLLEVGRLRRRRASFEDSDPGENPDSAVNRDAQIVGFWVAGDIVRVGDLPLMGGATYNGDAIGTVNTDLFGEGEVQTYTATGDMDMTWDFAERSGDMTISKFDQEHFRQSDGLDLEGQMCAPGTRMNCTTPAGQSFRRTSEPELPERRTSADGSPQIP